MRYLFEPQVSKRGMLHRNDSSKIAIEGLLNHLSMMPIINAFALGKVSRISPTNVIPGGFYPLLLLEIR